MVDVLKPLLAGGTSALERRAGTFSSGKRGILLPSPCRYTRHLFFEVAATVLVPFCLAVDGVQILGPPVTLRTTRSDL